MTEPVLVDGSQGEGGGQIVRSALALSLATGRPCRIERIRAGRPRPGLRRQHVACVELAAAIGAARVEGAAVGATSLLFEPTGCASGTWRVAVGTAGSASLVLQSVLPALLFAGAPCELEVEGGTHVPFAPPFEFLRDAWLPVLGRLGACVDAELLRVGFAPRGGGRVRVRVGPASAPRPLVLLERGRRRAVRATALLAHLPRHVADRELAVVQKRLGWPRKALEIEEHPDSLGPGNALLLRVEHEHVTEVFTAYGAVGVPAEQVARRACAEARRWMDGEAPVGPHLTDQLLLPLALSAGGAFRTSELTRHAATNVEVLRSFLGPTIRIEGGGADGVIVRVEAR
jgi:RNA 3'-terminal phosphate cyclase (ATP)